MSPHTHELRTFCALLLSACLGVACAETDAGDVDFNERSAGLVEPTDRFDWSGGYLLALSTVLAPEKPLLFSVHSEVSSDLSLVNLHIQALTTDSDSNPRSPVGDPFSLENIPYSEDGTFEVDLGDVAVLGQANPITGSDIAAQVQLTAGAYQAADDVPQHFCGDATGMVTQPVPVNIEGSTFGAVLTEDEKTAEPMLRCP